MGRRDEAEDVEMDEEAIRAKLLEAGWDKKRALKAKGDAAAGKDRGKDDKDDKPKDKSRGERRDRDRDRGRERKSSRGSHSRRSRSRSRRRDRDPDRDRDRERRSGRSSRHRTSSRRRSRSRSASKSRSAPRSSSKRHSSAKRRASKSRSRSTSRAKEPSSKRSCRSSRSPSGSASRKSRKRDDSVDKTKKEEKKDVPVEKADKPSEDDGKKKKKKEEGKDDDETETENEGDDESNDKDNNKEQEKKDDKEAVSPSATHKKSRKSSRRSRSKSRSRSSRHRRHHSSRSRSASRSRRSRRVSRSRSRSRSRRDRERRRRGRSASRSRSRSRSSRRHRRSSSRDRKRRDSHSSANAPDHPAGPTPGLPVPEAPVNPTITQLMQQYPTLSLQEIIAKMQAANVSMAAAAALKPARELYVGNLPPNITGPQLQEFLSTIIQQVGLTTQPGNPIVNTWLSADGHFAFCEMRTVEECNLALLLNQLPLLGQPLKFGRPKSFMGPAQPLPAISTRAQTALVNLGCTPNPMWFTGSPATTDLSSLGTTALPASIPPLTSSVVPVTAAAAVPSTAAPALSVAAQPTYNRLIMMNIPIVLNEDQVKELVEPFGKLRSIALVKDTTTGVPTASAVFEYEDASVTDQAASGLNGLDIGGIQLSVRRESATLIPPTVETPSPVVKMANMVSADELRDDDEFADLAEDVEEECKRFGTISRLEIPRPKEGEDVPGVGNIFVRFKDQSEAAAAIKALSGRKFGGNIVHVSYYPVDKFEKSEFV